ncbi:hypothetical protein LD119_00715 [Mesoplasma sp. JKS002660]|uniref:hypothetical protein n=1 Tax=Mesoplasma whartonense TaxID=2878854 RepID=UPI002022B34F|nr:hypothetical protein [Mesoplasma sp. JKS002660]MCL8213764.1 hypothetical protein [Mesoplasma sp. JKS002660]
MATDLIKDYKNSQKYLEEIEKLKQENVSLKRNIESLKQRIIDLQDEKLTKENKVNVQLKKVYSDPKDYTKYVDEERQVKIDDLEQQIKDLTTEKATTQAKLDEISNYINQTKNKSDYAFKIANQIGSIRGDKFEEGDNNESNN